MGLHKGQTNNPNGRPAGIPNRLTAEFRQTLKDSLQGHIDKIPEYLDSLDTKDKLEAITKLLPYILPKLSNIEMEGIISEKPKIDIKSLSTEELERRYEIVKEIETKGL